MCSYLVSTIDLAMGSMEMNRGSIDGIVQCHSLVHNDKFHSLLCVPMFVDSVHVSQTRIQALVRVTLLAASSSVICIKMAEVFVSTILAQITISLTSHCLGHKLKHLIIPKIMTYVHNTPVNCLQFLSEIFFNLHPCLIVAPQFAGGNLMGKWWNSLCYHVQKSFNTNVQTYSSSVKAQYLLNPNLSSNIHTILAVFPILSYKTSVHILI